MFSSRKFENSKQVKAHADGGLTLSKRPRRCSVATGDFVTNGKFIGIQPRPLPGGQRTQNDMTQNAQTPLTAIQILEQTIVQYQQQTEQAMAQLHATQGALMASQQLLGRLQAEEAKAKAAADAVARQEVAKQVAQVVDANTQTQATAQGIIEKVDEFEARL
jgi:hypothetical protein